MGWICLTITLALGCGVLARRRFGAAADTAASRLLTLMLYGLVPPVVFVSVTQLEVNRDVLGGVVAGWVALAGTGGLAWLVATRLLRLPRPSTGALIATALHGNTGYLGFPLTAVLLGPQSIGAAAVYDGLVQTPVFLIGVFAVGAAFSARPAERLPDRVRALLLRNPPLWAVLAGLVVPDRLLPTAAQALPAVLSLALLPLAFFAAGVTLAAAHPGAVLPVSSPSRAVLAGVALRLLICPTLLLALTIPLDVPPAYLLLAAAPAGPNGLIVAHAYNLDSTLLAQIVLWTTAVVITTGLVLSLR